MKRLLLLLPLVTALTYTAVAQSIPNPDFETWTAKTYTEPDTNWYTSNAISVARIGIPNDSSVAGASSTPHGMKIQTMVANGDTVIGYFSNTPYNPFSGRGGRPYTSVVTSLNFKYMNFSAGSGNDTSIMIIYFKAGGVVISRDTIKFSGTGPTYGATTWTTLNKPLHLGVQVPDTVIIAAISSNVLLGHGIGKSWLAIDEMQFVSGSSAAPIVGGTFDGASKTITTDSLGTWNIEGYGLFATGVTKGTPAQHGSTAVQLVTQPDGAGPGGLFPSPAQITSGMPMNLNSPSIPITGQPYTYVGADTLYGYYKYTPSGNDTGVMLVTLIKAGGLPVSTPIPHLLTATGATYVPFAIGWGAPAATPVDIRIDISSSDMAPKAGSTLVIDNLSLKSQGGSSYVNNVYTNSGNIIAFPNPANDVLNIYVNNVNGDVNVKVYDLAGKILMQNAFGNSGIVKLPVSSLPSGMYFYEVSDNTSTTRNKFIKE